MADPKKSLMLLGALGVILLVLVIIFSVTLLIGAKFKEKICTQDSGVMHGGLCYTNTSYTATAGGDAFNASNDLLNEVKTVISFVGLVVLGAIGYVLVGMAKSYMKEGDSY